MDEKVGSKTASEPTHHGNWNPNTKLFADHLSSIHHPSTHSSRSKETTIHPSIHPASKHP
jgi:hypothetical protein